MHGVEDGAQHHNGEELEAEGHYKSNKFAGLTGRTSQVRRECRESGSVKNVV
ncbi:MAG: hypothetical protein Kow002_05480 [Anaerolineales bacterium]